MGYNNNSSDLSDYEKTKADTKQRELDEVSQKLDRHKRAISAAHDLFRFPIPTHVWRPAWSNSQIVSLIIILYKQKKILSKTLEKIYNRWEDSQDFIHENIEMQLDQKLYRPHLEATYKEFEDYNYPRIKNMNEWLEKANIMHFPFEDKINEVKNKKGLK